MDTISEQPPAIQDVGLARPDHARCGAEQMALERSSATDGTKSKNPHRRHFKLPRKGANILKDYFNNVAKLPSATAREELAEKIRCSVPECEEYTAVQVSRYFASLRLKTGNTVRSIRPLSAAGLRRRCGKPAVNKLDVLLQESNDPTEEVASIWATTLGRGMTTEDILSYARLRREPVTESACGPIPALLDAEQPRTVVAHLPTPERSASPELRPTQRSLSSTTALDYRNAGAGSHENNSQSAHVDSEGPDTSPSGSSHSCGGVPNLRTTPDTSHDAPHLPHLPHTPNFSPSRPWLTRRVVQSDDRDAPLSQVASEPRRQCRSPTYFPQSTVQPPPISLHPVSFNAHRLASLLHDALHDTRSTSTPPAESERGSSDSQAGINIMRESSPPPKTFKQLSQWLRDADPNMMVPSLLLEIAVGRYTQFGLGLKPI